MRFDAEHTQTHVAEEGPYSVASSEEPILHYFPVRGRAEPIRLLFALHGVTWFEPLIEPVHAILRRDLDTYPFRQLPKLVDAANGSIDISQSLAILRHLGRKYGYYGKTPEQSANIDMLLEACRDLREALKEVWVVKGLAGDAVQKYMASVMAAEEQLLESDMPGPGLACLERILARVDTDRARQTDSEDSPWLVGQSISIADVLVFDLVDLHSQVPQLAEAHERFPLLLQHHQALSQLPGVATYLQSDNRHKLIWLADWQKAQRQE